MRHEQRVAQWETTVKAVEDKIVIQTNMNRKMQKSPKKLVLAATPTLLEL